MTTDLLKLSCYFGERDRVEGELVGDRLMDLFSDRELLCAGLLRAAEGFGHRQHMRTDRLLSLSEDLPVVAVAIGRRECIQAMLEPVRRVQRKGLLTLERVEAPSDAVSMQHAVRPADDELKLTVYVGRRERVGDAPAFRAITALFHECGLAGASVLLGVDGVIRGNRSRARFFAGNVQVPMLIMCVGGAKQVISAGAKLFGLLEAPLLTLERVRICKRDGELLARPPKLPKGEDFGRADIWQQLTVYSSHAALYQGRPLHQMIVRRLRESGAAGVTALSGVWGFHGDHAPHGDRFFQIARHVPVLTIAIDTPERIAHSFELIHELTGEHGLVTCELVPALQAIGLPGAGDGLSLPS